MAGNQSAYRKRPVQKQQSVSRTPAMYVQGNTVRKTDPKRIPEKRLPETPQKRIAVRRKQEKALQVDLPYLIMLVIAACCALYLCVNYLHIQSVIAGRLDNIEALEKELESLKSENDALETRINTYVDLDYVYKVATEELGMVYANKDQILLYDQTESEYIRQNEDIPQH